MMKDHAKAVAATLFVADLVLTIFVFIGTYMLMSIPNRHFNPLLPLDNYLWLLLFVVPVWTVLLQWSGTYRSQRISAPLQEIIQVARAAILGGIALFAFVGLTKSSHISRPFLAVFAVLDVSALVALRITLRTGVRYIRAHGHNTRSVLIVGTGAGALAHADRIEANAHWGHRLIGFISDEEKEVQAAVPPELLIGKTLDSLSHVLCEYVVDEVVFSVTPQRLSAIAPHLLHCEQVGVKTKLALDFFPHRIARIEMEEMDGCPMLTFSTTPPEDFAMLVKRGIDLIFSAAFLLSFSWLYAAIALAIKMTSKGPVLFRQERVGMNGRRFTFYKFRSMVIDADRRKAELQHLNEMDGPVFKIKNDPRVTRVGRFLRKFSLDEFPQMWNVLRGDMSLVGPRPPVPSEVEKYESWARRRLSVRPGITCLWQVSGRNSINFQQWMELDLAYIDNWTLGLDFKILLKTVPAVLGGRGAS
jgi:exopolysaccharide biosynthesis polyprenyl glycosylphosphotransferase